MFKSTVAVTGLLILLPISSAQVPTKQIGFATRSSFEAGSPSGSSSDVTSPATLTVPADTEAAITMLSGIQTRVSQVDDLVMARLNTPVYVNGRVALPTGSLIDGRITQVQPAGYLHHRAELAFRFDRITLPDGQTEAISAVLSGLEAPGLPQTHVDAEGYLKGSTHPSWKKIAGGLLGLGAGTTIAGALVGSAAVGAILPAGGAALLGYAALWPHGNDINMPPQTRCRIRLNDPVTVRVAW